MTTQYFVGIDVSKATLDFTVLKSGVFLFSEKVGNTAQEIADWLSALKTRTKAGGKNTLFCLEHMGAYKEHLYKVLKQKKAQIWMESPLHIKRSLGLKRGKSDQLDSLRIAQYAYIHREEAKFFQEPRQEIKDLKALSSLRQRLISAIGQLQTPAREIRSFYTKRFTQLLAGHCSTSILALKEDLRRTEETMQEIIQWDERLRHLYKIITSVVGIGPVVAVEMIITTNEFKNFDTANQFACHCGIAPFEHTSGTSLQGKTKVSKLANKRIRPLLHMAAVSSIRTKGEIQEYYYRKVADGKHKMKVLNAIKNKIIHRAFACVQEDRLYQKEYRPNEIKKPL